MKEQKSYLKNAHWVSLFALSFLLLQAGHVEATHLRAGQITAERVSCSSRQVKITITVYTDTGCSPCTLFGGEGEFLSFGDGNKVEVPVTANTPYPGVVNIGTASYTYFYEYPGPGRYTISYREPMRNNEVVNILNPGDNTFYIETQIDLSVGCENSPRLLVDPIDEACSGVAFFHNPGAYDPDGDSLSYELVIPFRDKNTPVTNYRDPSTPEFYAGLNYNLANEAGNGPPTLSIDPVDGTIRWDAPGQVGEYNIAFIIKEWRNINGQWIQIGFVRRDMQIIVVADCKNKRPELIIPKDTCVVAGTILHEIILGIDAPDNNIVKIEAFSEIFASSFASKATVLPSPPIFQPSNPPAQLQFNWNTVCEHVKDQAYQVVFKITDDPPLGPSLVGFETWRIKVIGPAPNPQSPTVDLLNRYVDLSWDPYACQTATAMQIWRRVNDTSFTPDQCQTGMPESLGYTLIATVPIDHSTYKDTNEGKGLAVGAKYCYRLVAIFPLPQGGESYVSNEVCINPILADAPVITHVTVDKTSKTGGEITVEWTPPFDIDPTQYPGPYQYELKRSEISGYTIVSPKINGTTWTDLGLDTRDRQYAYSVRLYSPAFPKAIDSSAVATSVWLDLHSQKNKIELDWRAAVPWSNQLQSDPLHDIYRGSEKSFANDSLIIESVNVIQNGLTYIDIGKLAPGDSLSKKTVYCYKVRTRGGYGNPSITEPLINYSQINCAQPINNLLPCAPIIQEFGDPCENFVREYGCDSNNFTNIIRWGACSDDIRSYNLYVASSEDGNYVLLASGLTDTLYEDKNLSSLARCYKVSAIDKSNNESELSEAVCNDNCPNYELPNVFSPGNADGKNCNELFSAFGVKLNLGENAACPESDIDRTKCARFVQKVDFSVYNRWGAKVYSYVGRRGDDNNNIYINWNGRDEKGKELATAVYYYIATVTVDVVNPAERVKIIKGWVQLVR